MSLNLENLDENGIRALMLEEFEMDLKGGNLYLSPRLKSDSKETYVKLLRDSILTGNDESLATTILKTNCLESTMMRNTRGRTSLAKMPVNAHIILSEGEFNRFYIRGLCRKAISDDLQVEVYRAKQARNPRPESQERIGKLLNSYELLEDLRKNVGVDTALGVPSGPNSGLSIRLKK